MKKTLYLLVATLVVSLGSSASSLRAEEAQTVDDAVLSQVEQLENLRESNPEAYRQWVSERKAELRRKFQQMDGARQARFKEFVSGRKGLRQERLKHFREQRPQAFERFKNQRMRRWQAQKQDSRTGGPRTGVNRAAEPRRQQVGPRGTGRRPGISRAGGQRGGRRR